MGQNILRSIEQAKKRTFWQEHLKSWQSSLIPDSAPDFTNKHPNSGLLNSSI